MKAIYLDTFAGISGNMFLGALMDAGFPLETLRAELQKLNLGEYELVYRQVNKLGIEAKYFNVLLPEEDHHHDHEHTHDHEHCHEHHHDDEHGHEHEHCHEHHHDDEHGHEHHHDHDHGEEHEHHHDEVAEAIPEAHTHEHHHDEDHHHEHEHCHEHEHHHEHDHEELPHTHHHHAHRNLHDIMTIINGSSLSASIKSKAEAVFTEIAKAESKVHGKPLDEVHFHEVGAIDTIIDIVGTLLGLEYLGIEKIYCGRINTGYGTVQCAHGIMPVPAPATAEILQGLPQERGIVAKEMTTPTGAALVKVLAEIALDIPGNFQSQRVAYGAGTREVVIPNVLRMYVGETVPAPEKLVVAACNLDDMTGEVFAYATEKLLANGALDAWAEPIYMKKGRPAYKLCFLAQASQLEKLLAVAFTETTTLGVRYHEVERAALERAWVEVELDAGKAQVKYARYQGQLVQVAPEFEDCKKLALATGKPVQAVMQAARQAAEVMLRG